MSAPGDRWLEFAHQDLQMTLSTPPSCSPYYCRERCYDVEIYDHTTGKREGKTIAVKPTNRRYGW